MSEKVLCHMDGCSVEPDMQLRAKLSSGDIVIPMCLAHAKAVVDNRNDYEMYDDSTIDMDLSKGMTITTIIKRFRRKP